MRCIGLSVSRGRSALSNGQIGRRAAERAAMPAPSSLVRRLPRRDCEHDSMSPQYSQSSWRHGPHGGVGASVSATTAMRVKTALAVRERLEERDALGAQRQAVGRVLDVAAGDDPRRRSVSSAAPTLKFEYRACARARARRPRRRPAPRRRRRRRPRSSSGTGCQPRSLRRSLPERRSAQRRSAVAAARPRRPVDDAAVAPLRRSPLRGAGCRTAIAIQLGVRAGSMMPSSSAMNCAAHAARRLHHFVVIERLRQHAGGRVGDARDAEHLDAHVPRDDRLGHGRHADGIGADRPQERGSPPAFRSSARAPRRRRRGRAACRCAARGLVGDARAAASSRPRSCRETAGRSARRSARPADCCPAG